VDLIDVRTPVEFREVHATIASNVPLETLDAGAVLAGIRKSNAAVCDLSIGKSWQAGL
jgi:rhodanese-related sulfurtransferase